MIALPPTTSVLLCHYFMISGRGYVSFILHFRLLVFHFWYLFSAIPMWACDEFVKENFQVTIILSNLCHRHWRRGYDDKIMQTVCIGDVLTGGSFHTIPFINSFTDWAFVVFLHFLKLPKLVLTDWKWEETVKHWFIIMVPELCWNGLEQLDMCIKW